MTSITLADIAKTPEHFTFQVQLGEGFILRPLLPDDVGDLMAFFAGLSPQTKRFSSYDDADAERAQEHCDAIARYDKLRFVLCSDSLIVGLLELSFAITDDDIARFPPYGESLTPSSDVRYGLCLADAIQNQKIGRGIFPYMIDLARRFERSRMILWGGVHADNPRAIRHYEALGFRPVGQFTNDDGLMCWDMLLSI